MIGLLKVGEKKLFHRGLSRKCSEIYPLCVLDFYVHESIQRGGYGKKIFEHMLSQEKVEPRKIAYDRPSPLLLRFLKKHYGLADYVPQNNKYVIYEQYFKVLNIFDD